VFTDLRKTHKTEFHRIPFLPSNKTSHLIFEDTVALEKSHTNLRNDLLETQEITTLGETHGRN